uniref:Uncharacterized protein n=1 Tax=Vitis vinifera TaxID=29760 RepID=A5APF1_VITVI|nr:hypothetical protein VITISV_042692 [Vitis vinifera]
MQFGWKGVGWQQWCSAGGAWATLNQVYEEQPHWIGVIVYVKKGVVCCSEAEACDPELMPILAGTLVAACYGCEQNKGVVQQEVSMDMLLSLLRSCRNALPGVRSNSILDSSRMDDSSECNTVGPESRKLLMDVSLRPSRHNARSTRGILGKGVASGNSLRLGKMRNQRDSKGLKTCEEMALKHNMQAPETPSALMLHFRFPSSFMDRAEQFFSAGTASGWEPLQEYTVKFLPIVAKFQFGFLRVFEAGHTKDTTATWEMIQILPVDASQWVSELLSFEGLSSLSSPPVVVLLCPEYALPGTLIRSSSSSISS